MAQMKGVLPDSQIAKFLRTQEAVERELGEKLKQEDASDRERNRDAFANSFAGRDSMNAELARMTPEERSMPAYINNALDHGPKATGWTMTTDSTPPAWQVLTPSFEFYRARRSPLEVRSIHLDMSMSWTCNTPRIRHSIWEAYHKLDWAAIHNLLEQPR
jgi:hypothetical protein